MAIIQKVGLKGSRIPRQLARHVRISAILIVPGSGIFRPCRYGKKIVFSAESSELSTYGRNNERALLNMRCGVISYRENYVSSSSFSNLCIGVIFSFFSLVLGMCEGFSVRIFCV